MHSSKCLRRAEDGENFEMDNKSSHFPLSARSAVLTALLIPVTKV
jgi:hypothetical protein